MFNFRVIQISAEISPNKSKTTNLNRFFWSEYILKTAAVLDHLLASSYAKFVRCHEHPKAVIAVYGLENPFYKNQAFTARSSESADDTV